MADRHRANSEGSSTDDAIDLDGETSIGAVPGTEVEPDISGFPGGATGFGAWPEGEGTRDDAPGSLDKRERDEEGEQIGARHGQIADSGVNSGPVAS